MYDKIPVMGVGTGTPEVKFLYFCFTMQLSQNANTNN